MLWCSAALVLVHALGVLLCWAPVAVRMHARAPGARAAVRLLLEGRIRGISRRDKRVISAQSRGCCTVLGRRAMLH